LKITVLEAAILANKAVYQIAIQIAGLSLCEQQTANLILGPIDFEANRF